MATRVHPNCRARQRVHRKRVPKFRMGGARTCCATRGRSAASNKIADVCVHPFRFFTHNPLRRRGVTANRELRHKCVQPDKISAKQSRIPSAADCRSCGVRRVTRDAVRAASQCQRYRSILHSAGQVVFALRCRQAPISFSNTRRSRRISFMRRSRSESFASKSPFTSEQDSPGKTRSSSSS